MPNPPPPLSLPLPTLFPLPFAPGSFDIRITAHGNKYQSNGFINELAALHNDRKAGFFFLFLRLYDPEPYPEDSER